MLNGMGRDRGAASALEQAVLPASVPPEQRTWALAWQHVALAGPLFIGGSLKIAYDILLYASFRHVRPPEEQVRPADASNA